MPFKNRWLIAGKLTTRTPLRIGSGDITERSALVNQQTKRPIQIGAVATDKDGRACIPGSALKGRLRAWGEAAGLAGLDNLFGSKDPTAEDSVGGIAEFYDCQLSNDSPTFIQPPPYWDPNRSTGVTASVTIDRPTRTASDERLFHQEFVPPGVTFGVLITAQDLEDLHLSDLLRALNALNSSNLRLGAATGDGWGQMEWDLRDLKRMSSQDVLDWVSKGAPTVGYAALRSVGESERKALQDKAQIRGTAPETESLVRLGVTLKFESHFLVNDPSQTGAVEDGKPAHAPLRDADGHIVLPASSFRGALRSQAERIIRTIHGEAAACYPDKRGPRPSCPAVYELGDLPLLCPVCRVFGAPGWRSPLAISAFRTEAPVPDDELVTQEFLAIDRFTGGGADGAKFNATAAYRPTLSGVIEVDLKALARAGAKRWALGLLTLTLRDLIEGDIRLGFGSSKGYGANRAEIAAVSLPAWTDCPETFKADLREELWRTEVFNRMSDDELRTVMQFWVMELNELSPSPTARGAKA